MNHEMRRQLYSARELLEIAVALACLDALEIALRLEHPTLRDEPACDDPPTLASARVVDRLGRRLRRAIGRYRNVLQAAIDAESDELPF
jgi:hypothetical protein